MVEWPDDDDDDNGDDDFFMRRRALSLLECSQLLAAGCTSAKFSFGRSYPCMRWLVVAGIDTCRWCRGLLLVQMTANGDAVQMLMVRQDLPRTVMNPIIRFSTRIPSVGPVSNAMDRDSWFHPSLGLLPRYR